MLLFAVAICMPHATCIIICHVHLLGPVPIQYMFIHVATCSYMYMYMYIPQALRSPVYTHVYIYSCNERFT